VSTVKGTRTSDLPAAVTFALPCGLVIESQWMSVEILLPRWRLSFVGVLTIAVIINRDYGLDLD
jgi:hypothetical protein